MMVKLWDSTWEKSPRELDNAGFIPGINVNFSSSSNTTLAVDFYSSLECKNRLSFFCFNWFKRKHRALMLLLSREFLLDKEVRFPFLY